jgi:hypothetical protein
MEAVERLRLLSELLTAPVRKLLWLYSKFSDSIEKRIASSNEMTVRTIGLHYYWTSKITNKKFSRRLFVKFIVFYNFLKI